MKLKFTLNEEFLEYLLNLSNQKYFRECYESITNLEMTIHLELYKLVSDNINLKNIKNENMYIM